MAENGTYARLFEDIAAEQRKKNEEINKAQAERNSAARRLLQEASEWWEQRLLPELIQYNNETPPHVAKFQVDTSQKLTDTHVVRLVRGQMLNVAFIVKVSGDRVAVYRYYDKAPGGNQEHIGELNSHTSDDSFGVSFIKYVTNQFAAQLR